MSGHVRGHTVDMSMDMIGHGHVMVMDTQYWSNSSYSGHVLGHTVDMSIGMSGHVHGQTVVVHLIYNLL